MGAKGYLELRLLDGEEKEVGQGDVLVIPGHVKHSGIALTDCEIIDFFAPVREEYKDLK